MATYWISVGASYVEFASDGTPSLAAASSSGAEPPCGLAVSPRPLTPPYAAWVTSSDVGFTFPPASPASLVVPFNLVLESTGDLLTVTPTNTAGGTTFGVTGNSALAAVFLRASDLLLAGGVATPPPAWYSGDALVLLAVVGAGTPSAASVPYLLATGVPTFTASAPTSVSGISVVTVSNGTPIAFAAVLPSGYAIGQEACNSIACPGPTHVAASWATSMTAWCDNGIAAFRWSNSYTFVTGVSAFMGNAPSPVNTVYNGVALPGTELVLGAAPTGTSLSCTMAPPNLSPLDAALPVGIYLFTALAVVVLLYWAIYPAWHRKMVQPPHRAAPISAAVLAWDYVRQT